MVLKTISPGCGVRASLMLFFSMSCSEARASRVFLCGGSPDYHENCCSKMSTRFTGYVSAGMGDCLSSSALPVPVGFATCTCRPQERLFGLVFFRHDFISDVTSQTRDRQ